MSKIAGHKVQLALAVLKGKRVQLVQLQEEYVERYKAYAEKFDKDPTDIPRTIYADMIEDYIKRIDKEIIVIQNNSIKKGEK